MKQKLTGKQKAFCREYIVDHNITQAAIRAGYSENYADKLGYDKLLGNVGIKNEIDRLEHKSIQKVEVTITEILTELKRIAFDLQSEKITYRDKLRAIELLGKHLGMFIEKHEIEINAKIDQRIMLLDIASEELANRYMREIDE